MARLLGSAMMANDDSTTDIIAERLYRSDSREPSKTTKAAESLGPFGALLPWLQGLDLDQRPLSYEPFPNGHQIQRATNNPS